MLPKQQKPVDFVDVPKLLPSLLEATSVPGAGALHGNLCGSIMVLYNFSVVVLSGPQTICHFYPHRKVQQRTGRNTWEVHGSAN